MIVLNCLLKETDCDVSIYDLAGHGSWSRLITGPTQPTMWFFFLWFLFLWFLFLRLILWKLTGA